MIEIEEGDEVIAFATRRIEPGIDVAAFLPGLETLEAAARGRFVVTCHALAREVKDADAPLPVPPVEFRDHCPHARVVFLIEHPVVNDVATGIDLRHSFQFAAQQLKLAAWNDGRRHGDSQPSRRSGVDENCSLHREYPVNVRELPRGGKSAPNDEHGANGRRIEELRQEDGEDGCA